MLKVLTMRSIIFSRVVTIVKRLRQSNIVHCRLRHVSNVSSDLIAPTPADHFLSFCEEFDDDSRLKFSRDMVIVDNFVSESEEDSMMDELKPVLKEMHYEFDHWDDAIHGYRETERLKWSPKNMQIIERVRRIAFPSETSHIPLVHVLDLAEEGFIKPHIDSVRFCGDIIAGISLLSSSVMRLVHEKEKSKCVDVLLPRRSLYIMTGTARYDYTHELLNKEMSIFKNEKVQRGRRLSIICRNMPLK
ncbi:alpha-ketoglutarate-dependent dioxygenase alkB homolog 7, mitochondrial [Ischnura elegans]|uniref:alpha-ketoglutarate-dependent dioxygenase alkB homolog 7, mitochondrial n=1 Tax=Ischnura elegans TaxID=197161 RepID=UPI001ED8BA58|nr:alpha-ketoglutarate-dependent dioxygenase alkB homolog 7, mitochondrial [Ischnura elegans]